MKAIIFLALLFFAPTASSYDVKCGDKCLQDDERPTCLELGYQKSTLTTCPEGYITCPYDEGDGSTYIWCKTYTCHDGDLFEPSEVSGKLEEGFVCYKTSYHERTCYTCIEEEVDPCIWSEENKGEGYLDPESLCENGKYKRCISPCQNATIPTGEGVVAKKRICTACDNSKLIISGYECHPYYEDTGNGCELKLCPTPTTYTDIPYSTSVTNCNGKGFPDGWIFETNGTQGGLPCGRCVPKECEAPYVPASQAPCNKPGLDDQGNGFTMINDGHSGDEWCRWCQSWSCTSPYDASYQSISNCPTSNKPGWSADKAWNFSTDPENEYCGLCTAKTCPEGYSENIQSIENCPNTSGYTFKTSSTTFNGQNYCGKCEIKTCASGSVGLTVNECEYPSTIGAYVEGTGVYSGTQECKQCACDASSSNCTYSMTNVSGKTALGTGGTGGNICCDGTYQTCTNTGCSGKAGSCPEHAICGETCSACGVTYYKATACEDDSYTLNTETNSCVSNTCATYSLTNPGDCSNDAYVCTRDETHSECCKTCVAKMCTDHNSTYLESATGTETCPTGYKRTNHYNLKSGTSQINCYDCNSCRTYDNYLNSVPINAKTYDTKYSCSRPKYCALTCNAGYQVSACSCVENPCTGYSAVTSIGNLIYFDYTSCKKGSSTLYKISGCSNGYSTKADCDSQKGDWFSRAEEQNVTCGKCYVCDSSKCGSTCSTSTQDCNGITYTQNNIPEHSHVTGTACTVKTKDANSNKCITGGTFYPSFECDTPDYTWNGTKCVVSSCASGMPYSSTQQEPYKSGYTCTKNSYTAGGEDCYDCTINTCASGSATSADDCGNGTSGANGWKLGSNTGVIAGTSACKYCQAKNCTPGYATTLAGCGSGGFTLSDVQSGFSGDSVCKKCVCDATHCGDNCATELHSCDGSFTSSIANATMTGACTIQSKTSDVCNAAQTVWSGFTCDANHCGDGSTHCNTSLNACDNHPYESTIANATMSGVCYRQTKSGNICDTPKTVYSGFTCNSGYHIYKFTNTCTENTCKHYTDHSESQSSIYYSDRNLGIKDGQCSDLSQNTASYIYRDYTVTGPSGTLSCCEVTAVTCDSGYYTTSTCSNACGATKYCFNTGSEQCPYTCQNCSSNTYSQSSCNNQCGDGQTCTNQWTGMTMSLNCEYHCVCPSGYYTNSSECTPANGCASGVCMAVSDHGVCGWKCQDSIQEQEICSTEYIYGSPFYGPTTSFSNCNNHCAKSCEIVGTSNKGNNCYGCCTNSSGATACAFR